MTEIRAIAADDLMLSPCYQQGSVTIHFTDQEELLIQTANNRVLREALEELVLLLREFEGLSYREIAEVRNIPIGTVMSSIQRARERTPPSFHYESLQSNSPAPQHFDRNARVVDYLISCLTHCYVPFLT